MVETKTITTTAITALITSLLILGGVNVFEDDNVYYCAERSIVYQCDKLSSTMKTCYNPDGNKICYEGWTEVIKDLPDVKKRRFQMISDLGIKSLEELAKTDPKVMWEKLLTIPRE